MERRTELLHYTAVDREYFESHGRRAIDETDFVDPLRRSMPADWTIHRNGIWMHCTPPGVDLPVQGWKIHVSSVPSTARIVLLITAAALVARGTPFKFAADARLLAALNGKRWPRGGSGKFITVYPRGIDDFRRIVEDLYAVLSGYAGPYVLTDRRYRDSRVLYYRYGGILGDFRVSAGGRREWILRGPDGEGEPDDRQPRFRLPEWLREPFSQEPATRDPSSRQLADGRYRVVRALTFSAAGGVYLAEDLDEGRRVVIKEARPHIGGEVPATALLRKEFRLLRRLAPLGVAPLPVACFQEWEHSYLVEEYVEGETLRSWLAGRYPWLKTRATRADVAAYLGEVCEVFSVLADLVERVHDAGVSLGDLSFHNCLVRPDGGVRLIDFEAAMEDGLDAPLDLRTPGFASRSPGRGNLVDARAEDAYAFGANLFAALAPVNALLPLDRHAAARFIRHLCTDMGYPAVLEGVLGELLAERPDERPTPVAAMQSLRIALQGLPADDVPVPHRTAHAPAAADAAAPLFDFIAAVARHARADRYVPGGPEVFESHPWGVAHGAAGVLHAFLRGGRTPPGDLPGYVLDGAAQRRDRGANLMHGDAGIAWVLFDAGEHEPAAALLRGSFVDRPVSRCPGLHDGLAGWGLARLKAWHATAEPAFLAAAVDAGKTLLGMAIAEGGTMRWPDESIQPVGLGEGASGIALFLLHLHVASGEARFLDAARSGLRFDLDQRALNPDGRPTWPKVRGGRALFPYRRHGTAGILAVAARFLACTGDSFYRDVVLEAECDLLRRHAISPGLFDGLAGMGETLLDLAAFLPDRASFYVDAAHRLAGGIEPFLIPRQGGLAVPGAELLRLSCDFATGNAGVGAFFDRLWRGGMASFMLDEHLPAGRGTPSAWRPGVPPLPVPTDGTSPPSARFATDKGSRRSSAGP